MGGSGIRSQATNFICMILHMKGTWSKGEVEYERVIGQQSSGHFVHNQYEVRLQNSRSGVCSF